MNSIIVGHRGLSGHFPENTRISISQAIEAGLTWVEVDIQLTKDDQLVVIHDYTIDRCSNGSGRVDQHTLQELKKLDFGRWFDASTANERIMTLSELLAIAKKNNLSLNLEVKQDPSNTNDTDCIKLAKRVGCELSKASNDKRTILLSSFSHQVIRQLAAYCNGYALGVISEKLNSSDIDLLNEVDAFSCHLNSQNISKDDIELLRKTGRQVWCYTVNEPKLFAELELVDAIFTDFPERF